MMADEFGQGSIVKLLEFLPRFEEQGRTFGDWSGFQDHVNESGRKTFIMGRLDYSSDVLEFNKAAYETGIVIAFDWGSWQEEAMRIQSDPQRLAKASLVDLRKLLTLHLRKERFCEGHLLSAFETGDIQAILRSLQRHVGPLAGE